MIRTARLQLSPVGGNDLQQLTALKASPIVFAQMLGGVRSPWQAADELAADIAFWATNRVGMFAVREGQTFHGIAGIHNRPDGRGLALRFAVWPDARGRGLAREAAGAALRYALDVAALPLVVAVANADNFASRMVLGAVGMVERDAFLRDGHIMLVYHAQGPT